MRFYLCSLRAYLATALALRLSVSALDSVPAFSALADELFDPLRAEFENVEWVVDHRCTSGRGYYAGLCFHIHATAPPGRELQLVDGGAVDWTQRLLSNSKERLVVSGIGTESLCALLGNDA